MIEIGLFECVAIALCVVIAGVELIDMIGRSRMRSRVVNCRNEMSRV